MFNQKITIYNRFLNKVEKKDNFHRTVIDKSHWESSIGIRLGGINVMTEDSVTVVIPMSTQGFVLPSEFKKLDDKSGKWTLGNGDYIIKGEGIDITSFNDLKDFDEKMVITSYEVNDQARIKRINNYTANGK